MVQLDHISDPLRELFYRMFERVELTAPSLETVEEFTKAQEELISLADNNDHEAIREFVQRRSNSPHYLKALAVQERDWDELAELSLALETPLRKSKLVNKQVAFAAARELRRGTLAYRKRYEETAYHRSRIAQYRVLTARAVQLASILQENEERGLGTFLCYEEPTLGALRLSGEYEINSPEWHEARRQGIGGSDVGAIMRVDSAFASQNYAKVLAAKLGDSTPDDDPLYRARNDLTTPIGRGNAWEEFLRQHMQRKHPELRIAFCKGSWHGIGDLSHRHANFDGLLLDESGVPYGILEIKTGSNPRKWGPEAEGFKGVPAAYRKQALWYAANAGLRGGKIVVMLMDNEFREYDFLLDDVELREEVQEIYRETDKFWQEILVKRKSAELPRQQGLHKKHVSLKAKESLDSISEVLAGYMGAPKEQAKEQLSEALSRAQGPTKRALSLVEFQNVVFESFAKQDPDVRDKPLMGIDIETTTVSARTGRIIETGIVALDGKGIPTIVYNSLHGLPELSLWGVGVGSVNVHHIEASHILGHEPFEQEAEKILDLLIDSTVVAHNAGFEDRFLSTNVPGYLEAKASGRIVVLDTLKVAKYLMPRSSDNTLQSFAEGNGIPYQGAHAAAQDALMMMQALLRLQRTLYSGGRFVTRRASATARLNASLLDGESLRG